MEIIWISLKLKDETCKLWYEIWNIFTYVYYYDFPEKIKHEEFIFNEFFFFSRIEISIFSRSYIINNDKL